MCSNRMLGALAVLVHLQLSIGACIDSNSGSCDSVASQGTSESQSSLLQMARQTDRIVTKDTPESQNMQVSVAEESSKNVLAPEASDAVKTDAVTKNILQLALDDIFLYDHLPKAGGSFVRGVLKDPKIIRPENLIVREENKGITETDRKRTFTVGSVRNPCDYYVSCWSFGGQALVQKRGQGYGVPRKFYGVSDGLNSTEDQIRFRKWVKYIMPPGHKPAGPGLLTARMLWSYDAESVARAKRPEPDLQTMSQTDRNTYAFAAKMFDPSSVDCWIKTETLTHDLRKCLARFDKHAGGGIVNWKEFNATIAKQEHDHERMTVNSDKSPNGERSVFTKRTEHQPCRFYYDKDTANLVRLADREIFSKFGYKTCCYDCKTCIAR